MFAILVHAGSQRQLNSPLEAVVPLLKGVDFSRVALYLINVIPKNKADDISKLTPRLNHLITRKTYAGNLPPFPKAGRLLPISHWSHQHTKYAALQQLLFPAKGVGSGYPSGLPGGKRAKTVGHGARNHRPVLTSGGRGGLTHLTTTPRF